MVFIFQFSFVIKLSHKIYKCVPVAITTWKFMGGCLNPQYVYGVSVVVFVCVFLWKFSNPFSN